MRLLLHHQSSKGAKGFDDLKITPDGVEHETFRSACANLGIIGDDSEWDSALEDAAQVAMPAQIRELYICGAPDIMRGRISSIARLH